MSDILVNKENIESLLQEILKILATSKPTPFYNEPIFLALVSIAFGGLLVTLITKHLEQRIKKRSMAIEFIEEVGARLNAVLSNIAGYRKKRLFGQCISSELNEKRGDLFRNMFSVRVKSEAYLGTDLFWEQYLLLIHEIDLAIHLMGMIENSEDNELWEKIIARKQNLINIWPSEEPLKMVQEFEIEVQKHFYELEKMLWIRANSFIATTLKEII